VHNVAVTQVHMNRPGASSCVAVFYHSALEIWEYGRQPSAQHVSAHVGKWDHADARPLSVTL